MEDLEEVVVVLEEAENVEENVEDSEEEEDPEEELPEEAEEAPEEVLKSLKVFNNHNKTNNKLNHNQIPEPHLRPLCSLLTFHSNSTMKLSVKS